jgi:hypothetical protein
MNGQVLDLVILVGSVPLLFYMWRMLWLNSGVQLVQRGFQPIRRESASEIA